LTDVDATWAAIPHPLPAWVAPPARALRGLRVTTGAELVAHGGVGPSLAPGGALFVGFGRRETDVLTPTFRLWGIAAPGGSIAATNAFAVATMHFLAGAFEACPVQLPASAFVRFYPCASFELGTLQGQGDGTVAHENRTRPWAAGDVTARAQWALVDHVVLELQGGLSFPFVRDTFFLATGAEAYAVPAVAGTLGAGVGVRFP
ncbi:MAG TPA: hypothetical protein VHB21_24415, partial [Minicystis sp.]|nr:hypothetical protein [Minicystis sp.]